MRRWLLAEGDHGEAVGGERRLPAEIASPGRVEREGGRRRKPGRRRAPTLGRGEGK